jgi:hypothetical protein
MRVYLVPEGDYLTRKRSSSRQLSEYVKTISKYIPAASVEEAEAPPSTSRDVEPSREPGPSRTREDVDEEAYPTPSPLLPTRQAPLTVAVPEPSVQVATRPESSMQVATRPVAGMQVATRQPLTSVTRGKRRREEEEEEDESEYEPAPKISRTRKLRSDSLGGRGRYWLC